jgi:hypothetical protein
MNEAQVRTLEQVRQVVTGTQALEFRGSQDDVGRYAWIEQVLRRFGYRQLGLVDKGVVLACVQRLSGYAVPVRLWTSWPACPRQTRACVRFTPVRAHVLWSSVGAPPGGVAAAPLSYRRQSHTGATGRSASRPRAAPGPGRGG